MKTKIFVTIALLVLIISLGGYKMFFKQKLSKINIANEDVLSLGLTGSMYKGNYVWGIAMNLA